MKLEEMIERRIIALIYSHPPSYDKEAFKQYSFKKWAYREIMNDLRKRNAIPFVVSDMDIVESFKAKMDRLAYLNPNTSMEFSIASEIAEELITSMNQEGR